MGKNAMVCPVFPVPTFISPNQLFRQSFAPVHVTKHLFRFGAPEDSAMLHSGARNALDSSKIQTILLQARQDQIQGL